ncbi:uncharacterized protein LOC111872387 isoform X4 [Cryptotermes secundus]|nr:uncharacterized protein LOC111872387 isoform X4 [Cryptotermes secundus]
MDTGDTGHSAWFQTRVKVLVRSLRAQQGASSSPQWGDRVKEEDASSSSSSSLPSERRSLQLGRSLASRWNQYSPGPLRRLKKFFSVTSERGHDDWDSESKDTRNVNVDDGRNYLETVGESPVATVSEDTFTKPRINTNGLNEVHQNTFPEELIVSDRSEDLQKERSSDSPYNPHPDQLYDKENCTHSKTLIPAAERLHIPLEHNPEEPTSYIPSKSATECDEVICNTPKQQHEFNKEFYILTTASDDDESRECWQQGEMTQWRLTDNDACTAKGRATDVRDGTNDSAVVSKEFALYQGLSGTDTSGDKLATLINGKLGECVVKTLAGEKQSGAALPLAASVGSTMSLSAKTKCSHEPQDSVCDEGMKGMSVVRECSVVVAKPDMETRVVGSDADELDCSTMSVPSIVLDQPPSTEHPTSSGLSSSDSQGPQRPPKLQLHIASTCSQSPARKSPVTVQEWVDSLPLHHRGEEEGGDDTPLEESDDHLGLGLGAEAGLLYDALPAVTVVSPAEPHTNTASVSKVTSAAHLVREPSVQSDVTSHTGSHCSSVESFLESRRPDPEEILLGLGFGGPVGGDGSVDTEVSRIPRRFLQPSKVKGVAINNFLRHQQDLIETFESGFCGYRGLTGSSHTPPSVIVAKIMEKLREHERENIPPPSVVSAPVIGNNGSTSPSLSIASNKFSRAARRVLTRTSVLGALPFIARQQQQSVLTPDNRRFLDNQGSKSPEVPRKRMIIGHRSYTFSCDGDLIELDPVAPTTPTQNFTPKPKPLVHKDSVLSTATSLSFTSIDSDSDTDDRSSIFVVQPRHNIIHEHPTNSTVKSNRFPSPSISPDTVAEKPIPQKVYPLYPISSKRMSSTSLSSWESEAVLLPIMSHSDVCSGARHQFTEEHVTELPEENDGVSRMVTKHYSHFHSSPEGPLSVSWPMRYESIDENVELKPDLSEDLSASKQSQDVPCEKKADRQSDSHVTNEEQDTKINSGYEPECREKAAHVECQSGSENGSDERYAVDGVSAPSGVQRSSKTLEEQMEIQTDVISLLQIRRGSFKRQQRILDEEEPLDVSVSDSAEVTEQCENSSDMSHKETQPLGLELDYAKSTHDAKEETEQGCAYGSLVPVDEMLPLENSRMEEHRLQKIHCVSNAKGEDPIQETQKVEMVQEEKTGLYLKDEELIEGINFAKEQTGDEFQCAENIEQPQDIDLLHVSSVGAKGDSFEMEEICTCGEEEAGMTLLSRAWSDSSGFLDGDSETYLSRQNGHNTDGTIIGSESSQCGGPSGTSNEATQMTNKTMSSSDLEVTIVPSCSSCDILNSDLVVSVNPCGETQVSMECPTDSSITSPTKECTLRSEIGLSAINQQNLPNSLFQELSSVNDLLDQRNVPCVQEHVCDANGSCAILHERQRSSENISIAEVTHKQNSFLINSATTKEANAHNFHVSNNVVPCERSSVSPRLQTFTRAYQDSSSERTLPGNHIPQNQPSVCTDDDLTRHRTMSLHTIHHRNSLLFGRVRRVRSAPHCLQHLASSDDMMHCSSWSSVSNMFSFCSDESVIHVGLQKSGSSRTNEKRPSDGLCKPEVVAERESGIIDVDAKDASDSTSNTRYLKPCAVPCVRNTRSSLSDVTVTGLNQLVGELALLHLQGNAVRAGLAAYGHQLVGERANEQNGRHEVAEVSKELQTVREVRDRIAAELRHVADLLEEQPPHRAVNITGQMAVLLREQTRLCQQLEALSSESSPSIYVEPPPCCSVLEAVREENRHLQTMVERNSQELKEIRQLLKELVAVKNSQR